MKNWIDLGYAVDELKCLEGSKIDTIFHSDRKISIRTDNHDLIILPEILYLTKKGRIKDITEFAMLLRKYLKNRVIESIEQYKLGMIAEIAAGDNILILEFFDGGNCIPCHAHSDGFSPSGGAGRLYHECQHVAARRSEKRRYLVNRGRLYGKTLRYTDLENQHVLSEVR